MKKTIAFHTTTKVLPGQKIEIHDPDLPPGETVEVFVVTHQQTPSGRSSILETIEAIRSHRPPRSVEEIDRFLTEERESWDS